MYNCHNKLKLYYYKETNKTNLKRKNVNWIPIKKI